jgi:uncharacterized protein
MLVEFTVGNYHSFYTPVCLSMVAADSITDHQGENDAQNNTLLAMNGSTRLLATSVVYGANGSGKSNLIQAMAFFKGFILNSFGRQGTELIPINRFGFQLLAQFEPAFFEMIFIIDQTRYRYGFEVDNEKVHSEWLFRLDANSQEQELVLFTRSFQEITVNPEALSVAIGLEQRARANALFLSTLEQFNVAEAHLILQWFTKHFAVISTLKIGSIQQSAIERIRYDSDFRQYAQGFLRSLHLGFESIELRERASEDASPEMLYTVHKVFDEKGFIVPEGEAKLDFSAQSDGTKKIFTLLSLLFDVLEQANIIILDELDSSFHSLLTREIIKLFHHQSKKKSQMIFAVHDTNLLRSDLFRRDQIWFTEKKETGETALYSLVEFKIDQTEYVSSDTLAMEKDYLAGRYGAIPFLGNLQRFINEFASKESHVE